MLTFFLTIIAGFIALSFISSLILGVMVMRKKRKEKQEYQERVDKSLARLEEETGHKIR